MEIISFRFFSSDLFVLLKNKASLKIIFHWFFLITTSRIKHYVIFLHLIGSDENFAFPPEKFGATFCAVLFPPKPSRPSGNFCSTHILHQWKTAFRLLVYLLGKSFHFQGMSFFYKHYLYCQNHIFMWCIDMLYNSFLLSAILAGLFAYSAQPITRGLISQIVNADEQGML